MPVFVANSIESVDFYLFKNQVKGQKIDCSELTKEEFLQLNQASLLQEVKIFVNLEKLGKSFTKNLTFLSNSYYFSKKHIFSEEVEVKELSELNFGEVEKFLKKNYNLSSKDFQAILNTLNVSKKDFSWRLLDKSAKLYTDAKTVNVDIDLVLNPLQAEKIIFNYINSLLEKKKDLSQVTEELILSNVPEQVIGSILYKKVLSLNFLSMNHEKPAMDTWKYPGASIRKARYLASKLGTGKLLEISDYVFLEFISNKSSKPRSLKIKELTNMLLN